LSPLPITILPLHFIFAVSRITLGAMNITQDQIKELDGLYAVSNLML
jgi:hypothetical protein